jgi:4-amino-4-deoxy-L-arabinose transferase-like glycosyltransferase
MADRGKGWGYLNRLTTWVRNHRTILLIVLLALVIRLWDLGGNPVGFFRDEADKAVTARSLLETGRDLDGRFLPYFVRSLNVYTSGIYQYVLIPFILLLGSSEFVVRLPAALAGSFTVFLTFFLAREAFDRRIAWVAAGILALSPWHVQFSRWANQGIFLPLFLALAVWFLLRGRGPNVEPDKDLGMPVRGYRFKPFFFSALFLSLALYTYAPAKAFLPLFFIAIVLIYRRDFFAPISGQRWPYFYKYLAIVLLLGLPMTWFTLFAQEQSSLRYDRISLFAPGTALADMVKTFLFNYFLHFSPDFLLWGGDGNLRHSPPNVGQMLAPEAIAFYLGLYGMLRRRTREDQLLLAWVFLAPIPASLTREGIPHALRTIQILPAAQIVAAYGLVKTIEYFVSREQRNLIQSWRPSRVLSSIWAGAFLLFGLVYLSIYWWVYPVRSSFYWEYGYAEAISYIEQHREPGQLAVFSGWTEYPRIHVLYHTEADLQVYQIDQEIKGYHFLPFGSFYQNVTVPAKSGYFVLTPVDPLYKPGDALIYGPEGEIHWQILHFP